MNSVSKLEFNWEKIKNLPGGHTSHVQSLHFSPSATHPGQLVSASWDGTLILGTAENTRGFV